MTLKKSFLGTIAGTLAITGAIAADGTTEPGDSIRVCDTAGLIGYTAPGSDICLAINGDIRARYHFLEPDVGDIKGDFTARGRIWLDARRKTNPEGFRSYIRVSSDVTNIKLDRAFLQIGGIVGGYADSFGNITYGEYALNANNGQYYVNNSSPMLGYSLGVGFGTSINLSVEKSPERNVQGYIEPINNGLIPDIGATIEVDQDWGALRVGGGFLSHRLEGLHLTYDITHPDWTALSAADKIKYGEDIYHANYVEQEDLSKFGFYAGGGFEIPIPGLADSTRIGVNGFYFSGAVSKMSGISSHKIAPRKATCGANEAECSNAFAGRVAKPRTERDEPLTNESPQTGDLEYFTREEYTALGDGKTPLQTIILFEDVNLTNSTATGKGYERDLTSTTGFSANGGLEHKFSPAISLGVNGGFFRATDGDYNQTGFMAGGAINYTFSSTTYSIGGDFASASISYTGADTNISTEFEADGDGTVDPRFSVTFSVSHSF